MRTAYRGPSQWQPGRASSPKATQVAPQQAYPPVSPLSLHFPGRAGELQAQGDTADAIRDLGDNYRTYHDELVLRLSKLGGRPDPSRFESVDAFRSAFAQAQEIVRLEALLRAARFAIASGEPLDYSYTGRVALLDDRDRLLLDP